MRVVLPVVTSTVVMAVLVVKFSAQRLNNTGSSRLMRISLLRISLLRFFKTITKIWLMRFYGLFILLLRT